MKSRLFLVIRREYLERVKRKSFIISTILMPIFMVAMMVLPSLIMVLSGPENKKIAVVDYSEIIAPALTSDNEIQFLPVDMQSTPDSIRNSKDFDALLIIGRNIVDNTSDVQYYTKGAPSIQTESFIRQQIEDVVKTQRIKKYDIENLREIISDLDVEVKLSTYRLDKEETEETSSMLAYFIGLAVAFMLYMFLLLYGNMVMNSIIEEKNNRVLEIVVSSVKPQVIMLGKILGVGLVALTQILIWAVIIGAFSAWVMPLISASISADDPTFTVALAQLSDPGYIISLFIYIIIFLTLGFMLYASLFAAVGSAVDNVQDASQLTTITTVPIMFGIIFSMAALTDPNSALSFWMSLIPFTSPMVMMCRIPFGIPAWQIILSIALLVVTVLFMVWLSAKIYRVGIFMYGKKPTFKDLIHWARYK